MDPYQKLGVPRGCASDELKEAFRTKALLVHTDRGVDAAEFARLREAYQQIANEITPKPPLSRAATTADEGQRTDAFRHQPDPNWEPDLIVRDEPVPRVQPVRPTDPEWEPELVVRDEPLPRIRPPRPRADNWEPELIVSEQESRSLAPISEPPSNLSPARRRDPKLLDRHYIGWLKGVVGRSADVSSSSSANDSLYATIGIASMVMFVVLSLCWMFWPSEGERAPTNSAELSSPLPKHGSSAEDRQTSLPEWPDLPLKFKKSASGESSERKSEPKGLLPLEQTGLDPEIPGPTP